MPFTVQARWTGLKEALAGLDGLGRRVRSKLERKAMMDGARVLRDEMKMRAPVYQPRSASDPIKPKLLVKSLGIKIKIYRQSGVAVAIVGPRVGFKTVRQPSGQRVREMTKFARVLGTRGGKTLYQNPTQYAHLAGPGRKQVFITQSLSAAEDRARDAIIESLREAVG